LKKKDNSAILTKRERFRESDISGKAAFILATWFGTGLLPLAPGTFGTMGAVPLVLALQHCPLACRIPFFLLFLVVAVWTSGRAECLLETSDPSQVVIDEVAGFLAATTFFQVSWQDVGIAFFVFRFFDILKPFPVGLLDRRLHGGTGIVMDDIAAGCYTMIVLLFLQAFLG
jgi:phosphatidylglycerophosphatase A